MGGLKRAALMPAFAAATLLTGAAAQDSITRCAINLSSGGGGLSASLSASVNATAEATAAIACGSNATGIAVDTESTAEAVAFAAAAAVANLSVGCFTSGASQFTVDGRSVASAQARAYAEAFASAAASAEVCAAANCSAAASFVGSAFADVFVEAVAVAEVSLDSSSPLRTVEIFAQDVQNQTAVAFAQAIATAQASVDDGCNLELLGIVQAGNDSSFCNVLAATVDNSTATNATVDLISEVVAVTGCFGNVSNVTNVTGQALASAVADVIAGVASFCDSTGNSSICFATEANISAIVEAQAEAFAFGFVNATSTCPTALCTVDAEILTEAVNNVLAEAATSAITTGCANSTNQTVDIVEVNREFVANTSLALASIISNVSVIGGQCFVDVNISAATLIQPLVNFSMSTSMNGAGGMMMPPPPPPPSSPPPPPPPPPPMTGPICPPDSACIRDNRQCAGEGFEVALACCSDEFLCVRRNDRFAQCRRGGVPGLVNWEGSILPCGVPSNISAADLPPPMP